VQPLSMTLAQPPLMILAVDTDTARLCSSRALLIQDIRRNLTGQTLGNCPHPHPVFAQWVTLYLPHLSSPSSLRHPLLLSI
jgi:hypothetical protein